MPSAKSASTQSRTKGGAKGGARGSARPFADSASVAGRNKKTKFDRIFGEDASRIRREAAAMSEKGGRKGQKSTKNTKNQYQKSKKR